MPYVWPQGPSTNGSKSWWWHWELPRPDRYGTCPLYFRDYINSHYWDAIINGTQGAYNGDVPRSAGLFYGWRGLYAANVPEDLAKIVTDSMRAYVFSFLELRFANTRLFTYDINNFDLRFRAWLMEWDIPFWRMIAALGYPFFSNMLYNNTASMDTSMSRSGTNQFSNSTGTSEMKAHESGGARDGQALFLKSANENKEASYQDAKGVAETSGSNSAVGGSTYGTAPQGQKFQHTEQLNPTTRQTIASIFPQSAITVGIGTASAAYVDPNFGNTLLDNDEMPMTNLVYAQNMQGDWQLPGPVDVTNAPELSRNGGLSYQTPTAERAQNSSDTNSQNMGVSELRNTAFQESLTNGITAAFSDRQDATLSKSIQSLISDTGNAVLRRGSAPNMQRMYEFQRSYELARDQRPFEILAQAFKSVLAYKRYDARHPIYPPYTDKVQIPIYTADSGGGFKQ